MYKYCKYSEVWDSVTDNILVVPDVLGEGRSTCTHMMEFLFLGQRSDGKTQTTKSTSKS